MTAPLVFLDTETTGVHPGRQVWEVAMIRRDDEGQRETSFFVDVDLSDADLFGLNIGRFYERHPLGKEIRQGGRNRPLLGVRSQQETAEKVAHWTHGAHVVGAVPNFDAEVLGKLLRDNALVPSWHYHLIDVEALALGYLWGKQAGWDESSDWLWQIHETRDCGLPMPGKATRPAVTLPWKSDLLTSLIGLDPTPEDERHTAFGDAKWAMRIYDKVTGQ